MSESSFTQKIPNDNPLINSEVQYGMRYPNGDTRWNSDNMVYFKHLDNPDSTQVHSEWKQALLRRAVEAKIDAHDYSAGHRLIKRTITIAITAPEEV